MRRLSLFIIIAVLFFVPSFSHSSQLGSLRISLIRGDVQVRDGVTGEWSPALLNLPLREDDTLWVGESGRVEIQMDDGSFLRLDEDSTLRIIMISDGIMWFDLKGGQAYVNFKGRRDRTVKIGIPYLTTLRTEVPSKFSIDFRNRRYAEVSVFKGMVYADVRGDMSSIHAGQTFSIDEDLYADVSSLGPPDEWERWNRQRDRGLECRCYSYRYLPDELGVYAYEFDTNGKWVYTVRYGYVWVPTVYIRPGWAPYRYGRWVWIGDTYVWIPDEPWGWVPYHYGRWAFSISIGWFWVPPSGTAVYWGPGFVGWIWTPDYVAWVPLAPEDIYYGYGYYGPRSVNIIHIDIHKTVIRNVYRNVYVSNAVTVVNRDSFNRGRYIIRTDVNPFVRIRPQRTYMVSKRVSLLPVRVENRRTLIKTTRDYDVKRHEAEGIITTQRTVKHRDRIRLAKERTHRAYRTERRIYKVPQKGRGVDRGIRIKRERQHARRHIQAPVIRDTRDEAGRKTVLKERRKRPSREGFHTIKGKTRGEQIHIRPNKKRLSKRRMVMRDDVNRWARR
jgi:hypothetical protein